MHALCYCLKTLNVTEDVEEEAALVESLCAVAYRGVFPVFVVIAVITNLLNVVVLLRPHSTGRLHPTPVRKYLLWMALSHCVLCSTVLVGVAMRERVGLSFSWAFYFAHLEHTVYDLFNCSCAWIVVGVSLDRHQAVCHPHKYSANASHARAPYRIALAYGVSAAVYLPHSFAQRPVFSASYVGWHVSNSTLFGTKGWVAWAVLSQALHRLAPTIILAVLNARILTAVSKLSRSGVRPGGRHGSTASCRRDRQITNLLLALTLSFLVTNVPSGILKLAYIAGGEHCQINAPLEIARSVANCLEMAGYGSDFLLYFLMNPEYRRDLHAILSDLWTKCGVHGKCPLPEISEERPTSPNPSAG